MQWSKSNTENGSEQPPFDNPAIFQYSYSNQPGHPNQQFRSGFKTLVTLNFSSLNYWEHLAEVCAVPSCIKSGAN
jgi:hypothetical protein